MKRLKILNKCIRCGVEFHPWKLTQKFCSWKCGSGFNNYLTWARFQPGHVPAYKIKKGQRISPATEFKKGHCMNRKEIGHITIRKRKRDRKEICSFIKTEQPNVWMITSHFVWIKKYGRLLPGDIVYHLNGDVLDNEVHNLIAMPKSHYQQFKNHTRNIKKLTKEQKKFYKNRYLNGNGGVNESVET